MSVATKPMLGAPTPAPRPPQIMESARTSRGDTTAGPAAWQVRGFWFYTLNKIIQAVNTLPTLGPSRATAPGPATMEATGGRIIISSTYSTLTYYSILIIAQKIRVSDGKRVRLTFTNFWVCMNICIVYRKSYKDVLKLHCILIYRPRDITMFFTSLGRFVTRGSSVMTPTFTATWVRQ